MRSLLTAVEDEGLDASVRPGRLSLALVPVLSRCGACGGDVPVAVQAAEVVLLPYGVRQI